MINKLYKNIKDFIKDNWVFFIFLITLIVILNIRFPWSVYSPGGLIQVDSRLSGDINKHEGSINMTYVTFREGTIPSLFLGFILPEWDIVSNKDITLEGEDLEIATKRDKISMEESISNATYLSQIKALNDIKINNTNIYVMYILNEAKTTLEVGDKILAYDDIPLEEFDDFKEYVGAKELGAEINIKVLRDNQEKNATAEVVLIDDSKLVGITISKINEYEMDKEIIYERKDKESGSSGGLMLSLAMYNALIEEDITNGKNVCGTGTIDIDGNVGEISGVKYKLSGASKNKCDIFLVPTNNLKEALEVKEAHNYDIKIIEAINFDQVLMELEKN